MNEKNVTEAAICYNESWKSSHAKYFSHEFVDSHTADNTIEMLKKDNIGNRITFIAYDKGAAVGVVTIDKDLSELAHLYIAPEKQRQGIGTKLMEFAIKQMTNINRVYVTILSVNEVGLSFYEKYGFEFTGEQKCLKNGMLELKYVFKKKK